VYDPSDGKIVHMHHVVVFEGGKKVNEQEAENEAMHRAKSRGHAADKLKTLLVHHHAVPRGGRFRVDLVSKKLVALEIPRRGHKEVRSKL
jgi:hypothetical protein